MKLTSPALITMVIVGSIVFVGFGGGAQTSYGYFQDKFHCSLHSSTLQIASNPFTESALCLDLVRQLHWREKEIASQLDWINSEPASSYNRSVRITLTRQRADITKLIGQMISGVNNLELKLYTNYKKKYFTKLKPIRSKLIAKQAVLNADLAQSVAKGEALLVGKIIRTIGFNYQRIKLIEGILASKSLDEMIPLLQTYETLIANQLKGSSE
ncbi:MAG: hypothetical protein WC004_01115 [Candidatus Absconditabacterales bacterium]